MQTSYPAQPHHEAGQGLVEYAFILVMVAIAVIVALTLFGADLVGVYEAGMLGVRYPQFEELVDYCLEGNKGQINSLTNQLENNTSTYINRVKGMAEDGTISKGCATRMLSFADKT